MIQCREKKNPVDYLDWYYDMKSWFLYRGSSGPRLLGLKIQLSGFCGK